MDRKEYYTEIERIAKWLSSGDYKEETGLDDEYDALHQLLDYHEYIIYYHKAYQVMGFTDHQDAISDVDMTDAFGAELTYRDINCRYARHAMEADIHDAISQQLMASAAAREPHWLLELVEDYERRTGGSDE